MCDNCNSKFDLTQNIPYLLPCGHSMCKTCFDTQYNKYKYTKCSVDRNVHHQSKDKYPKNEYLIDLIEENDQSKRETNKLNKIASSTRLTFWKKRSLFGFRFNPLSLPLWTYWVKVVLFNWIKVEEDGSSQTYRYIRWIANLAIALVIHGLLIYYCDFIIVFVFIVLVNETLTLIKDKKKAETDAKFNNIFNDRARKCNRKWFYSFLFFCGKKLLEWLEVRVLFSVIPKIIFAIYLTS